MKARDVMTTNVVSVKSGVTVGQVAEIMVKRHISAVPVVDDGGKLVGIVSEGDLMHRAEMGTDQPRSWWLYVLSGEEKLAADFIKANARKVADVMTRDVISVAPDTPLGEIATLLEKKAIKRVPVVSDGQLVGIVSRANLVQALAAAGKQALFQIAPSDAAIREKLLARLQTEPWAHTTFLNVVVNDGVVDLWGMVYSSKEKDAIRVAAEALPGVRTVNDNLTVRAAAAGY